jgi:hypothetical protein
LAVDVSTDVMAMMLCSVACSTPCGCMMSLVLPVRVPPLMKVMSSAVPWMRIEFLSLVF